jgi:hypothetical protein
MDRMTRLSALFVVLALAGCQVYAGGGTLISDGRTTTVRTAEAEAGTDAAPRVRRARTVVTQE